MKPGAIYFHYYEVKQKVAAARALKKFIPVIFADFNFPLERVDYIFCTDAYLLTLNRAFLKHNTYTDIITFSLGENIVPVKGEVYVSMERVLENAVKLGVSFKSELSRVIFHGALHLCGHQDKSKSSKKLMTQLEDYYLELLRSST